MVQSLKPEFDIDLWPFVLKIYKSPLYVMVNISVKYHYCMSELSCRKGETCIPQQLRWQGV